MKKTITTQQTTYMLNPKPKSKYYGIVTAIPKPGKKAKNYGLLPFNKGDLNVKVQLKYQIQALTKLGVSVPAFVSSQGKTSIGVGTGYSGWFSFTSHHTATDFLQRHSFI